MIKNYIHYEMNGYMELLHDAFSSKCVHQPIDLGEIYEVKFIGELGVPVTVEGALISCIVEGTWCKYLNIVDSKTGYTWKIYTGNGSEERGIISMIGVVRCKKAKRDQEILDSVVTEVDSCKNSRPIYHGSKNHDMFETMFNAPGGKPIRSINKDF